MNKHRLAIVVPCYKEELVLHETTSRLTQVLDDLVKDDLIATNSYILYVNDGSTDNTWSIISELHEANKYVNGVNLAGNVGHQNALVAFPTRRSSDLLKTATWQSPSMPTFRTM